MKNLKSRIQDKSIHLYLPEHGFFIDEYFAGRVKKKFKGKKKKEAIDQELCAAVIEEFLNAFEEVEE